MSEEKPVSMGKKVFFLNPTYSLKKEIIPALQALEFEVYYSDNLLTLKNILKSYRDSLLFITPDNQYSFKAYFNYIHSFYDDPDLKDIKIGIMAKQQKDTEKDLYLTKGRLELGYSLLDEKNPEKTVASLKTLFEMNDVKGRRQYVRARCMEDKEAKVFWTIKDKMHLFNILDISSAALAVKAPSHLAPELKPEMVLHSLTLLLDGRQYLFDASIYAVKPKDDCLMIVLLFRKNVPSETLQAVRKYIFTNLQAAADSLGTSLPKDPVSYSTLTYYDEATGKGKDSKSEGKQAKDETVPGKAPEKAPEDKPTEEQDEKEASDPENKETEEEKNETENQ